jgi:RNA polymerase primary sigma factor
MLAASKGSKALCEVLLELQVNVTATDRHGRSASSYARNAGWIDLACWLEHVERECAAKEHASTDPFRAHSSLALQSSWDQSLQGLLGLGAAQGYLTASQIVAVVPLRFMDSEARSAIQDTIAASGIPIYDGPLWNDAALDPDASDDCAEDALWNGEGTPDTPSDVNDEDSVGIDPFASYIREIRRIEPITRTEELELAIRVESCYDDARKGLSQFLPAYSRLLAVYKNVDAGLQTLRDLVVGFAVNCNAASTVSSPPDETSVESKPVTSEESEDADFGLSTPDLSEARTRFETLAALYRRVHRSLDQFGCSDRRTEILREQLSARFIELVLAPQMFDSLIETMRSTHKQIVSLERHVFELAIDGFDISPAATKKMFRDVQSISVICKALISRRPVSSIKRSAVAAQVVELQSQIASIETQCGMSIGDAKALCHSTFVAVARNIDAKKVLVERNLRWVVSVARNYRSRGLPLSDLIQEGNIGLMKAVDKFDHRRGYRLTTYATWWIRQSISRAIEDQARLIRIPVHASYRLYDIKRFSNNVWATSGRTPRIGELAEHAGVSEDAVHRLLAVSEDVLSLDTIIPQEKSFDPDEEFETLFERERSEEILSDRIQDDHSVSPIDSAISDSLYDSVRAVLAQLTPREAKVLRMRFGINEATDYTLEEIGKRFELTRERIRQIEEKGLRKLRHPRRSSQLRSFVSDEPKE